MNRLFSSFFPIGLLIAVGLFCLPALEASDLVIIKTDNTSMILSAQKNSPCSLLYYGEQLNTPESLLNEKYKNYPDTNEPCQWSIYSSYGGRFIMTPALKITHCDGILTTELIYERHEQKITDSNQTETIIYLKDKLYPINVELHFTAYGKEDIISEYVVLSNQEKANIRIENIASSYISFHASSYYLSHFSGTWAHEMQMCEEELKPGMKVIQTNKGTRTTQSENSAFILSFDRPAQEYEGSLFGGALAWSGNYRMAFELDETGSVHCIAGMNPFAGSLIIQKGESISTPVFIMSYSREGRSKLTHSFHDWTRRYALAHSSQVRPIILNSWEGAYFSFNEQTLTGMIDKAAELGIEMFVLDDGWFGDKCPRDNDRCGLGDWVCNMRKLPHGIDYLAKYAKSKGLKFGIWIEPEMVNPESSLAKEHPEWIVRSGKREPLPMRNQWLLDLSNPKVQDFVVETFNQVVALSDDISYVKWDANRHVDNVGSTYLPTNKQSHFWYEYTKGLYSVYARIRAKHPDIQIQLCSSGGGRLDFGALPFHDEFWASDNTNPLSRLFIQYGTNLFFPAIATGSHVSTNPNHQTGMVTPLKFRFDVAMSGRLGMELQPKDLNAEDFSFAENAVKTYKEIRPIVQFGDLYRINSPYDNKGWYSLMYVSKDKKDAVLFVYCLDYLPRTSFYRTILHGLNQNASYTIEEVNVNKKKFYAEGKSYSGDFLMKAGLMFTMNQPFQSKVLRLKMK